MFWSKQRAVRRVAHAERDQRADHDRVAADHEARVGQMRRLIEQARVFRGLSPADLAVRSPMVLQPGERVYLIIDQVQLVESRSVGGQSFGESHGASVRVPGTRSMRYRIGMTHGHFVVGEPVATAVDTGPCVITDHRVVFVGSRMHHEWAWPKCVAVDHYADTALTTISVSNRSRVSGIVYSVAQTVDIRFMIDLALAVATAGTDLFITELETDLAELDATSLQLSDTPTLSDLG